MVANKENLNLIKRLYSEVYSKPDTVSLLEDFVNDNVILHDPASSRAHPEGLEDIKMTEESYQKAVPNKKTRIDDAFSANDEKVVVRWTCTGTQEREFQGVRPTQKNFKISGISIYRFADGKICEIWQQWDRLGLFEQIGQVPTSSGALH